MQSINSVNRQLKDFPYKTVDSLHLIDQNGTPQGSQLAKQSKLNQSNSTLKKRKNKLERSKQKQPSDKQQITSRLPVGGDLSNTSSLTNKERTVENTGPSGSS